MLACRTVLMLTQVLILLMPLTEHFCKWDNFPLGGTDLEFFVLCLLLFAGLVLLMAQRAATSPFLGLLAHRLIALALPPVLMPGLAPACSVLCKTRGGQSTPPALLSHFGTPLRI